MGECFQDEHRFAKMFSHMGECSPIWEKISQVERAPLLLVQFRTGPDGINVINHTASACILHCTVTRARTNPAVHALAALYFYSINLQLLL